MTAHRRTHGGGAESEHARGFGVLREPVGVGSNGARRSNAHVGVASTSRGFRTFVDEHVARHVTALRGTQKTHQRSSSSSSKATGSF
jgi:hypothetical protein